MFHSIEEAIVDLRKGKPIIVVDDETRENEGDLVALAEKATPDVINFMITHGKGLVCTSIKADLAKRLGLSMMTDQSTDPFGTAFTVSIDHKDTTTGISAVERSKTIQSLLRQDVRAEEFKQPGHVFPLMAKDGGVLTRPGHTEASLDLANLSGAFPSGVICEIIKEDGTMARVPDLLKMSKQFSLKIITIKALIDYRKKHERHVKREVETVLPTEFGTFSVIGYSNDLDDKEHIALVKGDIQSDIPTLTRIHSECLTGDVFGSYRCDCGSQLHEALAKINEAGRGVLIYMRQEGRGIGLMNKLRAYKLQDSGADTVEANEQLGFAPDLREYDLSAQILLDLGVKKVDLLTNNPAKITSLEPHGITVERRIPLQTPPRKENEKYMHTKFAKLSHLLELHH
ncbi:bifunctional 3,4-dihydroxy-2-butanone-4-phosphate synthase/GTP cyclohydrolase II [Virgibacillus dakarensis]|uniref:Riboflavin biosynthesis protein RibBA n=1 Tax=Lentibacillus populi TaxID=1827502 RepID=A0A9W5TZT0_9BACI|nr:MULTISPECIES: bifunctional 3,4-dihydroxy-2-butanone-4-phosphate synthase/GTP cyclohydrolase II [Bacillaceae]MBT2217342.1 bifunctional 3,4-dihydroxy-2-butanone-4-phosphate synthase/GTP cyclohydrolase II [Virgibacillus dakarensis]MTW87358.1 bifunctional 3,4-dihydroxy-2-butanone-4-phosphate synthase/GTP cyclohydrolase II [Virgibacillus dakarensis]GGB50736.1 riboflavin biosynthesis protein RibBA [Lentibacillus populi]